MQALHKTPEIKVTVIAGPWACDQEFSAVCCDPTNCWKTTGRNWLIKCGQQEAGELHDHHTGHEGRLVIPELSKADDGAASHPAQRCGT